MSSRAFEKLRYSPLCAFFLLPSTGCIELALVGSALDSTEDDDLPYCSYAEPDADPPSTAFAGGASARRPGQLARVQLDVSVDEQTVSNLEALDLTMLVKTGQALPGQALELTLEEQRLQLASIGGTFGNEARFHVSVLSEQCAAPCALRFFVSGPSVERSVAVPIELEGTVSLRIQDDPSSCPLPPSVRVHDADKETTDAG